MCDLGLIFKMIDIIYLFCLFKDGLYVLEKESGFMFIFLFVVCYL